MDHFSGPDRALV